MHFENSVVHKAPGIDDAEGKSYRDYDRTGRQNTVMQNKANLSGVRGLQTASFRKDSPIRNLQVRFPEKYTSEAVVVDLNSDQVIKNIFPQTSSVQILSERS